MSRILVFATAFITLTYGLCWPTIINIPADYPAIQQGIDASVDGDTVLVQPGIYVENINFNGHNIVLGSLFLTTGDTSYISTTIVDGDSAGTVIVFGNGEDSTAIIIGFTIQNGIAAGGGGINCQNSHPKILNNIIQNNVGTNSDGGIRGEYSNPIVKNNIIRDNMTNGGGGGMRFSYGNPVIKHNLIVNNIGNEGGGLYLNNNSPLVENNTISGNIANTIGGGLRTANASPTVTNCIIYNNTAPYGSEMSIWGSPIISYCDIQDTLWPGVGNISIDPMFCLSDTAYYWLAENSPCVGTGQNGANIGALGVGCETPTDILEDNFLLPSEISLSQNYPNPFNAQTTIQYSLPEPSNVTIEIYDLLGRKIETLVYEEKQTGRHQVIWYSDDHSSGIYFYRLKAEDMVETKRMLLLR